MISSDVVQLARAGNPKAIAALMNRALQPKGITVKTTFNGECLFVLLESAQVPNQQELSAWFKKGMINLKAPCIHRVKLYGRQAGKKNPAWNKEFELILPTHLSLDVASSSTVSSSGAGELLALPGNSLAESETINEASAGAEDGANPLEMFGIGATVLGVIGILMALVLNPGNVNNPSQGYASFALLLISFLFVLPLGVLALVVGASFRFSRRDRI
jgi:hypothetical protein